MTVARVYRMIAQPDLAENLRDALVAFGPMVSGQDGCIGVEVFQDQSDPTRFLLLEKWSSVDHHQRALAAMPEGALDGIMTALAGKPEASYETML